MGINKKFKACLLVFLALASMQLGLIEIFSAIKPIGASASSEYPVIQVYPEFVSVGVGETFTVAVVGLNFTNAKIVPPGYTYPVWIGNLYGFEIEFTWDPTVLKYVSHNVTCPVENYPGPNPPSPYGGALHNPVIPVKNVVNESGNIPNAQYPETRAWISYASMYPAQPQNGNVTFFTITFQALKMGESPLKILRCELAAEDGTPIYHVVEDGVYRTAGVPSADFIYWPSIPVVGKPTNFTATVSGNNTNIKTYMWDFGDGVKQNTTQSTITHIYTDYGEKNVGLKVVDENDVESSWKYKVIRVVTSRDLEISSISFPATKIKVNPSVPFTFKVAITNKGETDENCTVYTYYNTTVVDPANPNLASWQLIDSQNVALPYGGAKILDFKINTTTVTINASYYILANMTTSIPEGYEKDVNNNVMLSSETFLVTNVDIHEITIVNLECVWQSGTVKASPPLIEGEDVTALLTVKNSGTGGDEIYIELFLNNSSVENRTVPISWGETKEVSLFRQKVDVGRYNISVTVIAGDFITRKSTTLRVIKPPQINFTYSPTVVVKNQLITFNASTTIHPDGVVTRYKWEFFAPGLDWTTANPTAKDEGLTVTYNFTVTGNWTVVLKIEDNFGLKYDPRRPATSAYIKQIQINVAEAAAEVKGHEGIPTEYIIAIIIVVVLITAASIIYLRKRKAARIIVEEE